MYILDAAYDAGIRHFDVARAYGHGLSEGYLGAFLRRRGVAPLDYRARFAVNGRAEH